ncbi:PLD-like domain-containing protein [Rhizobiales bacterium GAS113]|nr:PLD-like domain-containing protein [Rhizobiales bacterium GAS113]
MSEHVSLTDSSASEDADRETAEELARVYLQASGGDPERACHVLAFRTLRLVRSSSAGFVRGTMEAALRSDCEAHRTVETGSYNYSYSAQRSNAENVVVLWNHTDVARAYEERFSQLWAEGHDYGGRQ